MQDRAAEVDGDSKKALKEKGIDEILEEARESNRENDLEHLKRACEFFLLLFGGGGIGDKC